ncbi:MAG: elongation factor Ts, partial [Thermodesulfobacteriota bacterium]|nr:elongation factor Ts [Thermodesulfobacteriota bacterium]
EILKIKGLSKVEKKSGRNTPEGLVFSYIHAGGKIGVLVEINCETDFVARNDEFQSFAREIAMQIAASDPTFVSKEDINDNFVENERKIIIAQVEESGKKAEVAEKMIEGKLNKRLEESCLMNQVYIRDSKMKIEDLVNELVSKLGENIKISRFIRYQVGETQTDG